MNLQLAAISAKVAPGRHAALLLDQAGWHTAPQLTVPANISIVPLPAKCPELNAQENVWQFLRENWLSNRIFTCYDNLVDHCCHAWNKLVAPPWTIMSIGLPRVLISESWYKPRLSNRPNRAEITQHRIRLDRAHSRGWRNCPALCS